MDDYKNCTTVFKGLIIVTDIARRAVNLIEKSPQVVYRGTFSTYGKYRKI